MIIKKSVDLVKIVIDEVALEGLDGITLEALWQRLAVTLGEILPLKQAFKEQVWKICLDREDFIFYELEKPREKLIIFDRYELEYLGSEAEKEFDERDIYEHCPLEDLKLGNRGSCSTYYTRKNISDIFKDSSLTDTDKYGQKLVIVASQMLRERALIEESVSPTIQLSLAHYCVLERIGRTRKIGEVTTKKAKNVKEDAKALFYIRKGLHEHGLIRKQVYYQGNTGASYNGQNMGTLIHLTRFYNVRKPKVIMWAEHLMNYLKSKENYAAEYNEVKAELNLEYSIKKFFKIQMLQKVFRTDVKVPYRSYYPNSLDKEWQTKANASKEKIIRLVVLSDPNIEISDVWTSEEVKEDIENHSQLDVRNQKLNISFLKQIYTTVESHGSKGSSQSELSAEMGFTKLIGRTLVRNLVKAKIVSTYLDDVGRQRTTKFVSRKFDEKSSVKKQLEEEILKIKAYGKSMQVKSKSSKETKDSFIVSKVIENSKNHKMMQVKTEKNSDQSKISNAPNHIDDEIKTPLLRIANNILYKYKIYSKKTKYQYTSRKKNPKFSKLKSLTVDVNVDKNNGVSHKETLDLNKSGRDTEIVDSDFYKTIETKLIIQNPSCKKKSQRAPVVGFMEDVDNSDNMQFGLSYRLLRRANLVMESIKKYKIIEDLQSLIKYINAEEEKEGLEVKMDKNSLIRVLQKLSKDNMIKYITLILKNEHLNKQKEVNFICDPSVEVNDSVIESAVEKAKLKFCVMEMCSLTESRNLKTSSTNISNRDYVIRMRKVMEGTISLPKSNSLGKKHGYCPKFIRMKITHIFLYYLIYDHLQQPIPCDEFFKKLKLDGFFIEDLLDFNMTLYYEEINWKMFIPPLPKHKGYPTGWALMCDLLLRMPLSIFVKINNVNYEVPGMQEYLAHPIKKHFLIKDLPPTIRNLLLIKRRYMFNFHQVVTRLCFIGLVQFGPQQLKEKDQVFIYLNRHTELMDTTSSAAGYHKIEDKPYPVTKFTFTSMAVVENYWYEMWNTCINTCLGGRIAVEGKDILLEELSRKIEMVEALKAKQIHEAEKYDMGSVPGDRKGAAGIDSAFFAHLKRNWNWINTSVQSAQKIYKPPNSTKLQKSKIHSVLPRKTVQLKKVNSPVKKNIPLKTRELLKSSKVKREKTQTALNFPIIIANKPIKVVRKVLPRKKMSRRRVKYDEIDFSALQRMDKLRVDWEQHEDNILLVCKVAMVYLCPNPRRNPVTFIAIRDILRSFSFSSYNKTSRACQRRLLYMLKQQKTWNSVLLGVEEIKQDYYVNKRFGDILEKLRNERENQIEFEKKVEKVFKDLVFYIAKKYYNISNSDYREPVPIPKTIQEFNIFYKLKLPTKIILTPGVSTEVRAISDIHTATINSVIHSSMCCGKERRSWAYQLFKVYQQYSEALLRNAMLKIRADQMVTMKKSYMCAHKKFGNCMPMSSSQYQLSSAYYYKFQTKWPYEVFSESYNILFSLLENCVEKKNDEAVDGLEVKPAIGGTVVALNDLVGTQKVDIDIEIPDQIIMLDPGLPEKDQVYQRIALRYQTILENLSHDVSLQIMESTDCSNLVINTEARNFQRLNIIESHSMKLEDNSSEITNLIDNQEMNCNREDVSNNKTDQKFIARKSAKRPSKNVFSQPDIKKQKVTEEIEFASGQNKAISKLIVNKTINDNINKETEPMVIDYCEKPIENNQSENITRLNQERLADAKNNAIYESKISSTRVSELVKRMVYPEIIEDVAGRVDIQDVRTRQTRIAMLKMREELHDLNLQDSHHAHEYFVVNSFKLLASLIANEDEKVPISYQGLELPKTLLPIDIELVNQVLDSIKSFAVFPKMSMSHDDLQKVIGEENVFSWEDVSSICKFIKAKTAFGATLHELVKTFSHYGNKLLEILTMLSEKRMVLRAGIVTVRYIYHRYVNPWIIESYKILRLERESHQTVPEGSVYILDNEEMIDKDKETNRVTTAANLFYNLSTESNSEYSKKKETIDHEKSVEDLEKDHIHLNNRHENLGCRNTEINTINVVPKSNENPDPEVNAMDDNNDDDDDKVQKKLRRNRTVLLKQKDVYRAAKLLDFNTAEEIRVVIKPWIRIDGVLNRRVLDRMLGAVLCYCIEKPGASLTLIQNRFTPALQPYHTRELIEILVKLTCLYTSVQKKGKVTLFSKPAELDLSGNPGLVADSNLIIVHPSIQASLKFGTFLSNRSYNLDFLSTL